MRRILFMVRLMRAAALFTLLVACRSAGTAVSESNDAVPARPPTQIGATHRTVGTDPGGVGMGTPLAAKSGRELAAFAGGCFWGVEDTFRQVPGVTATAV